MSDEPRRRVYVLDRELHDRIVAYQASRGFASEVEAVRRLIEIGLQSADTAPGLAERLRQMIARGVDQRAAAEAVLWGHPLVRSMRFFDDGVSFSTPNGSVFHVENRPTAVASVTSSDPRPDNCRDRLEHEGKPHPKSGCSVSGCNPLVTGCIAVAGAAS